MAKVNPIRNRVRIESVRGGNENQKDNSHREYGDPMENNQDNPSPPGAGGDPPGDDPSGGGDSSFDSDDYEEEDETSEDSEESSEKVYDEEGSYRLSDVINKRINTLRNEVHL